MSLVACSGVGASSGRDAPTVDDFPAAIAGAECEALYRCTIASGQIVVTQAGLRDAPTCATRIAAMHAADYAPLVALVHAGRVRYDRDAARRCLDRIGGACTESGTYAEDLFGAHAPPRERPCAEAFVGAVPLGGECSRTEECGADSYCAGRTDCLGTCRARTPLGGACTDAIECQHAGLRGQAECYGPGRSAMRTCIDRVRGSTTARLMEPCGVVLNGTTGTYVACGDGLGCDNETPRRCTPAVAADQPCNTGQTDEICVAGSACYMTNLTGSTCLEIAPVLVHEVGGMCGGLLVGSCDPWDRLECAPGLRCALHGDGNLGSPCDIFHPRDVMGCNPGFHCDRATAVCVEMKPAGAPCESDDACLSGGCSTATHTCAPQACVPQS